MIRAAAPPVGHDLASPAGRSHPRVIGWVGTTALAMGGSNQSLFLIGAVITSQGSAAIPLLVVGLLLSWAALPGWTELILMWPDRVGGIAATCSEAFKPYSPVLANLAGTCYWWGWVPTCGLTALLSATALHDWYLPGLPVKVLACILVMLFTVANLLGVRRVTRLAVAIASGSAILAFLSAVVPVFAGSVDWHRATSFHLKAPFGGAFGHFTSAMAGLYLIGFAAPAFEAAACHVGETIDPARNVPRAMFASAGMATLYFLVLPVVWLGVLGPEALTGDLTRALGPTFAPLFGGMARAGAVWFMVLNMFHGTLTPVTGVARTLSQLSEDGLLPRSLARRTRTDVPWVASAVTGVMAMAFLVGGDPVWVIAAANFAYLIGICLPSVAVWLLRRNEPDRPRLYRAPRGTISVGLFAAGAWGISAVFGFEQFGLPTVLAGLGLAYSGAVAYAWRQWRDRRGGPKTVRRSLQLKLTGAMLAVLGLDGAGYFLAVRNVSAEPRLISILQDIFVAVAMLTITVGLVLPGMIAHQATELAEAANRLVSGTLADLTRAMRALASGDLDHARARAENQHVVIRSADEIGAMAASFNVILDEAARAAGSLDEAREALQSHRSELQRLVTERTDHAAKQTALAEFGRRVISSSDAHVVRDLAMDVVTGALGVERACLTEFRSSDRTMALVGDTAPSPDEAAAPFIVSTASHWWPVLHASGPSALGVQAIGEMLGDDAADGPGMWALIGSHQDMRSGLVVTSHDPDRSFTADDLAFLGAVASVAGSAIDRIRAEEQLGHQALHDSMTGLPNRVLFQDRLALALARLGRHPSTIAVLFVDIDHFKVINDSLGHGQGDLVLIEIAARLQSAVRPGDTVARFGGDEFVVLCEGLASEVDAVGIAGRIRAAASGPIEVQGRSHHLTVSAGIATTEANDVTPADLIRDADAAMYEAKNAGRGQTTLFDESTRRRAVQRLDVELSLRRAIAEGELRVHYQPIYNLATRRADEVEALVRWEQPSGALIRPDEFIPIAEESGLIIPLGEWVLREACRQTQHWRTTFPELSHLGVSVNVSGRQVAQSDLVNVVAEVLADTGLPPHALVLEITESVLMRDVEHASTMLQALKSLGIALSIDDFGTGYSSLSYLTKFPVDVLKIDRSFVDGLGRHDEAAAIVAATISVAHSLGLRTVGEGTETADQVAALVELGCDMAQGYFFCRPAPAAQLTEHLCNAQDGLAVGRPER